MGIHTYSIGRLVPWLGQHASRLSVLGRSDHATRLSDHPEGEGVLIPIEAASFDSSRTANAPGSSVIPHFFVGFSHNTVVNKLRIEIEDKTRNSVIVAPYRQRPRLVVDGRIMDNMLPAQDRNRLPALRTDAALVASEIVAAFLARVSFGNALMTQSRNATD